MRAMARTPEHREPHRTDERDLGEDDGDLPAVGEDLEERLHHFANASSRRK